HAARAGGRLPRRGRQPVVDTEPAAVAVTALLPASRARRFADADAPPPRAGRRGQPERRPNSRPRHGESVSAIEYRGVSFAYPDAPGGSLRDVDLDVAPGEVLLVVGESGSGKSTLLRAANGLVPHATGGRFGGDVVTFGRSTRTHHPRELADVVGFVGQ